MEFKLLERDNAVPQGFFCPFLMKPPKSLFSFSCKFPVIFVLFLSFFVFSVRILYFHLEIDPALPRPPD